MLIGLPVFFGTAFMLSAVCGTWVTIEIMFMCQAGKLRVTLGLAVPSALRIGIGL